jgi:SAM-dependent methyltransferase
VAGPAISDSVTGLDSFLNGAIRDLGAAMSAILVTIGDELGFFNALALGPLTAHELAQRTGTAERCVREWLANQAAGGNVEFEPAFGRYSLNTAQVAAFANRDGPHDLTNSYHVIESFYRMKDRALQAYRTGERLSWEEHEPSLLDGVERFPCTTYRTYLLNSWLPSLDGLVDKLKGGAHAADVGCGQGASTLMMAQAFPACEFVGIDSNAAAIQQARTRAAAAGVSNVRFVAGEAASFQEGELDFICFLNTLHDMPEPGAFARHAYHQLRSDGHALIVEPRAADRIEENLNPVGRLYYAASAMVCVPNALSAEGTKLGAQAGARALEEVLVEEGGFTRFRRVCETPLSVVLEARP